MNTQFARILTLLVILAPLGSCATPINPKNLPQATVPSYSPVETSATNAPTIKGIYTESTGLLGAPSNVTFLVAIDGQFFDVHDDAKPHAVPAGQHMVAIGYAIADRSAQVPAFVNFKPGASYVIKQENTGLTLNSFNNSGTDDTLWIEDEKTGEIVTPKLSTDIYDSKIRYVPPAGTTSTISGSSNGHLFDGLIAVVQMVDGAVVDGDGKASVLDGEHPRVDYAVPLTVGRHGLAIRVSYNRNYFTYPIMFDVKPNTSYTIKVDAPVNKLFSNRLAIVIPIWIEEISTGAIAFPKVDLPIYVGKSFTSEQLGQTKTPTTAVK